MLREQPASSARRCCDSPRSRRRARNRSGCGGSVDASMGRQIGAPNPSGQLLAENRRDLVLVTGFLSWEGRSLAPEHDEYSRFWVAWRLQGSWDRFEHEAFWRMNLAYWPRRSKQRASSDLVRRVAELQR